MTPTNIEDRLEKSGAKPPDDKTKSPPPKTIQSFRRDPAWYADPATHPRWVKSFATSGEIPAAAARADQARGEFPADHRESLRRRKAWDTACKELRRLKLEALIAWQHNGEGTPLRRAAVQRMVDIDDEVDRIRCARDAGEVLHLRAFGALDLGAAELVAATKRATEPLFDPRAAAANAAAEEYDDINDSMGR